MSTKKNKHLTAAAVDELRNSIASLAGRVHQLERAVRVLGTTSQRDHMTEGQLRESVRAAHSLSNAMREIKRNIQEHGDEFDREPYLPDPDK